MLTNATKVKLFTHNDLDGIGCEIVGRLAFLDIDVTIVKNPQDASEKVHEFIMSGESSEYDKVFITDISISDEVAYKIDCAFHNSKFILLDHHGTAEYLNKYDWAMVMVDGIDGKNSGTSMFFEYLVMQGHFIKEIYKDALTIFVEKVRRYDCWEWKTIYDDIESSSLNQLFWLLGREEFVSRYILRFITSDIFSVREGSWLQMFDDADIAILRVDSAKKDAYFIKKDKEMLRIPYGGHHIGVVFAEQYISEVGNYLSEVNEGLKFIALVDMGGKKVSLRTIHDDIDLGKDVAKQFGGGGHAKASGFQFDKIHAVRLVDFIFQAGTLSKVLKFIDKFSKK